MAEVEPPRSKRRPVVIAVSCAALVAIVAGVSWYAQPAVMFGQNGVLAKALGTAGPAKAPTTLPPVASNALTVPSVTALGPAVPLAPPAPPQEEASVSTVGPEPGSPLASGRASSVDTPPVEQRSSVQMPTATKASSAPPGADSARGRVRIAEGETSAEVVEATLSPSAGESLDGRTLGSPVPLAAEAPLPTTGDQGQPFAAGRFFVNVEVGADGLVGAVETVDASRADPQFVTAAVAAMKRWRFQPAELDGAPVASRVLMVVERR